VLESKVAIVSRSQDQKNDIAQRNFGKAYDELESNEKVRV